MKQETRCRAGQTMSGSVCAEREGCSPSGTSCTGRKQYLSSSLHRLLFCPLSGLYKCCLSGESVLQPKMDSCLDSRNRLLLSVLARAPRVEAVVLFPVSSPWLCSLPEMAHQSFQTRWSSWDSHSARHSLHDALISSFWN